MDRAAGVVVETQLARTARFSGARVVKVEATEVATEEKEVEVTPSEKARRSLVATEVMVAVLMVAEEWAALAR